LDVAAPEEAAARVFARTRDRVRSGAPQKKQRAEQRGWPMAMGPMNRGEAPEGRALPQIELSVVVPVRNAEQTIAGTLEQLAMWVKQLRLVTEVIVVDDGSDDSTDEAARLSRRHCDGFQLCRHERARGLGAAARTGLLAARGPYVLVSDPEVTLLFENARMLLDSLAAGADVALFARHRRAPRAERSFLERAADTTFLAVSRLFVPTGVRDGLCGLIALRQRAGEKIAERAQVDGPAFTMEWLAVARMFNFHVVESPLLAAEAGTRTSLLTAGGAPGMLKDLWRTHRRLADEAYAAAQPRGALLHQTSFTKLDRQELAAIRSHAARPRHRA
jgi:dolichyl-phosphate beta-glucosyltransferase